MEVSKFAVGVVLIFSVVGALGKSIEKIQIEEQSRIYEDVFRYYHRLVAPVRAHPHNTEATAPVTVDLRLVIQKILDVNTQIGSVTARIWLFQSWTDHRLVFNSSSGIKMLHTAPSLLWVPDIALYNGELRVDEPVRNAIVYPSGYVYHSPVYVATTTCEKFERFFPHDRLTCSFNFGSWAMDASYIDFTSQNRTLLEFHHEHPEWKVTDEAPVRRSQKYECCPEEYVDITYVVHLDREPSFIMSTMSIPVMLISLTLVFTFALPPASREKMTLAVGILISLAVYNSMLLKVTTSVTALSSVVLFAIVMDLLLLAETALVYNVYYRITRTRHIPEWIRTVFIDMLSRPLCLTKPSMRKYDGVLKFSHSEGDGKMGDVEQLENTTELQDFGEEWRFVARVIDRFFFWLFVLVFSIGMACILAPTS
ncbi:neuronal acetylcholine receptor subunit alpha-3-like [Ptychodera flava]|uniref:neuronal acetylcholine receptor subunit alpha-3-like n=1 Tax=Ptychodera flava TaxID=63121 RepID=UPI00396A6EF6